MFLRQQLKAIQKELGEGEDGDDDLKGLKEKLDALVLTEEVRKEIDREWKKLQRLSRESMEAQVLRNYLELVAELPWSARSEEHLDVVEAQRILDEDHYALKDVKDRILEFLAVRQLLGRKPAEAAPAATAPEAADGREGRSAEGGRREARRGEEHHEPGPDPPLRRSSRRRKDLDREVDRARPRPQVREDLVRRGARRGRHPRPPADLRRRDARPDHPGDAAGRDEEPGLPPRRGRQARRLHAGGPRRGAPRGPRPGPERQLHRPLPQRPVRPLRGPLHRDGELRPVDSRPAPRPARGDRVLRLHGAREDPDRPELPPPEAARRERPERPTSSR